MMPKVIKNESEYEAALARIDEILDIDSDPALDTNEGRELDSLVALVERYEDIHYPIPKPASAS